VIESDLAESGGGLSEEQRASLVSLWKQAMQRVGFLLGGTRRDVVELEKLELDALMARVHSGAPANDVAATLQDWTRQPLTQPLERLARQALTLARRLQKPEPKIIIDAHGVRLDTAGWAPFWSAMVHVVRNAVDHGIEDADGRGVAGKPEAATLQLTAERIGRELVISVRDDGRGIDWQRVRAKAAEAGLPHTEQSDLIAALFQDGFSTRDQATAVSGRGVGLGALRATVDALGGRIEVETTLGHGTQFRFRFDEQFAARAAAQAPRHSVTSLLPVAS
jgi:chemotaxis protein histidine kinase CheA